MKSVFYLILCQFSDLLNDVVKWELQHHQPLFSFLELSAFEYTKM